MALDSSTSKGKCILGALGIVCFALGMLIGHLVTPSEDASAIVPPQEGQSMSAFSPRPVRVGTITTTMKDEEAYSFTADKFKSETDELQKLLDRYDTQKIKENLRYLSAEPHMAATPRDEELANYIQHTFENAQFDVSELIPYNILLSKPNPDNPNKVTVKQNGATIFESQHKEIPIHEGDDDPNFVHAFNAFTPAGSVETMPGVGVVYVNYGRIEDFQELERLGVNITGYIAIVRYGKIYRGNKIQHAEQAGAIGIIIYSDPADVALDGTEPANVYDKTWWLPGTGMQRGSTYLGEGDPLTPGWPSTEYAYRLSEAEANLHNIPAQPLGYSDARFLLERLDGETAPVDWQGGLPKMVYKIGPNFLSQYGELTVNLTTHNAAKIEKNYNVIGIIKGSVEPDRYVIMGNHRDAWGYGASDPSSGTAQLLETIRVYGTLLKEGWRPRRTLVFCSWGAEEFGVIGSREWVEEHVDKLQARGVAYINTDTCASGPKLYINASPMLWNVFHNVTSMIPGVEDASRTIFDEWKEYFEVLKPDAPEKPVMDTLGSGSDFAPFTILTGIPAADIWFRRDQTKHNISTYPFYHTGYETFYMVSTFVDPEFKLMRACGQIAATAMKYIADSTIIPYSFTRYPEVMMKSLLENENRQKLIDIYDKYGELERAVERFQLSADNFNQMIMKLKDPTLLEQRAINDQLMKLEQSFIIPEGLPGRATVRHAVFAPSEFDNYASAGFPGLTDGLFGYDDLGPEEQEIKNKEIRKHISDLTIMTDRASSLLKSTHVI